MSFHCVALAIAVLVINSCDALKSTSFLPIDSVITLRVFN
ncbi:hypothetical protein Barb4_04735 [Bacteroidales bacterium Barb4]|nr:hypothetical protein Barb4_04735 [Bacteroidales bacterium Barb4]